MQVSASGQLYVSSFGAGIFAGNANNFNSITTYIDPSFTNGDAFQVMPDGSLYFSRWDSGGGPVGAFATDANGQLWFTEGGNRVGHTDAGGNLVEFSIPNFASDITADPKDNCLWFVGPTGMLGKIQ